MAEPSPAGTPAGQAMIQVQNLTKVYGLTRAVDEVSFAVGKGEILGFLGPNGAGKTTTMRILTGYTPATSGRALIAGYDIVKQSFEARKVVGYLPESAPLYIDMYVRDYLRFMAEVKRSPGNKIKAYVNEAMEECGLTDVAGRMIRNLSKGYRQRVGLAQALLGNPEVLVLDEPTVGLDPRQIHDIRELIKGMAGRRTVILSTHILPEVSMTCQKVIIISRGRIEAQGTPENLVSSMAGESAIMVTAEGPRAEILELLGRIGGVTQVTHDRQQGAANVYRVEVGGGANPRAEIARALVQAGHALLELTSTGLSLEDIFLRVISSQREVA
jgi:ABC-2 type transport system ATP-binding protein